MIHLGTPNNPTEVRAMTDQFTMGDTETDYFITHQIARWWGLSFGAKWFFGFMTFGLTRRVDLSRPAPPSASEEE